MIDRACPYYQHCRQSGYCDDCEYHMKFESYKKQIRQMKKKIEILQAEVCSIRGIDDFRMK